MVSEDLHDLV